MIMTTRGAALSVAAGAVLLGVSYLGRRAERRPAAMSGPDVIPIVTPFIDVDVAEGVLAAMERLPDAPLTLVVHTLGGSVTACVLIANALRHFRDSTAVVPYMAISGGTLIALSATHLEMGRRASLSAVDPVIMGHRVKHLVDREDDRSIAGLAREYEAAVRRYLRGTLAARVPADRLDAAVHRFMGEEAPHEWPIEKPEVEALGLPVALASARWAALVDQLRGTR